MSKKKIVAPKTHDPGKGRPREHLAYLNEREMAYLRSLNGNNMERGPKGIPSFADDSASSRGVSRGDSSGTRGSSGSSGSTSSRGSGPGGPNGPNSGPSTNSGGGGSGGLGQGGQGGAGPAGPSGPNSGPSRGAGGQSSNFGGGGQGNSPRGPSGPNSGPSASVGGGQRGAGSNYGRGSGRPAADLDKRVQQAVQVKDTRQVMTTTALKGDLLTGGIRSINVGPIGTAVPVPSAYASPDVARAQRISDSIKRAAAEAMRQQYGAYKNPAAEAQEFVGSEEAKRRAEVERLTEEIRQIYKYGPFPTATGNPNMAGNFGRPQTPTSAGLPSFPVPGPLTIGDTYGSAPQGQRPTYAAGTYTSPYDPRVLSPTQQAAVEALAPAHGISSQFRPLSEAGEVYDPNNVSDQPKIPNWAQSIPTVKTRGIPASTDESAPPSGADTVPSDENPIQDDTVDSPNISPTTQMPPPGLPERTWPQKMFERTSIGQLGRFMNWGIGKEYENLTPQEQADLMGRWIAQRDQYIRNQSPRNDRRDYMGPDVSGGSGRGNREPTERQPTTPTESGRPQIYYMWDVGVNIPSPGDSNYTLYQQYLAERDSAYG